MTRRESGRGATALASRALRATRTLPAALVVTMLVPALAGPACAHPPPDLGPEVALGEPSGGYVGRLEVTPAHAPAGTPVTVAATGLPPGEEFQVAWGTAKGAWKVTQAEYRGREFTPVAYEIARATSDAGGRLAVTFIAPDDFGFMHDIVLQRAGRLFTQAAFSLDMTVEISPRSGPPGTPITVEARGIGYRSLYNSWDVIYDNNFTGWMSSVTTGGTARFTIPATGGPGVHVIEVMHGELTFPYRNPEQNPVPGRPRFAFQFTVTDGAPVKPPPPAEQAQETVRRLPPPGDLVAAPPFAGVGEETTARAEGLTPGESYKLNFSRVVGNRMSGQGWEESSITVAESTANGAGRAEFRFATPDDLGGPHGLWLDTGMGRKTGSFWIKPTALPMDVTRGPAGTTFTIHLKGVGWTETANLYNVVYDNSHTGYVCAFNSQGDVEITMRATGAPGMHYIDLYPGIYRGTETRPNNFRIPQLTYADDHPGEDLPAFHFAFEVTPGTQRAELGK
ncbi:MAG: hypothetical protein J2P53_11455 [Bradyrhizobiaceae bacterium]|nr:hypothetical protein [Bradyrhizobiaceae bacterium]